MDEICVLFCSAGFYSVTRMHATKSKNPRHEDAHPLALALFFCSLGHAPMSPMMEQAMRSVEEHCSWDVSSLCSRPGENPIDLNLMLAGDGLSTMLNKMMDSAVRLANEQPTYVMLSLIDDQTPKQVARSEQVFHSMVSNLVSSLSSDEEEVEEESNDSEEVEEESNGSEEEVEEESSDSEESEGLDPVVLDPIELSKRIIEHGERVMNQAQAEGDEHRHRLARRLTEVHPGMFHHEHRGGPRLPFGCRQNHCLMSAYEQGAVSSQCANALHQVQEVKEMEVSHQMAVAERQSETFFGLALLYGLLCIGTFILLHCRLSKLGRRMQGKRRLKRRIIQSVYNNPDIKAAVASDLDEDLGHVPPLPPHVLARMSGKEPRHNWKLFRFLKVVLLCGVMVLAIVNPILAMPVMCVVIGIRFVQLAFFPPKMPKRECSCCCCGASTTDVAKGNLTAAQECCTCCKSTGVCAPNCAACCGDDGCCGKGCCCCGATAEAAAAGKLTKAQACCCCCGGTGCCSGDSGCCCCCGGGNSGCCSGDGGCCSGDGCCCCGDSCCSGDGCCCSGKASQKRSVRYAKEKAYMGIPVQVV